jgi:hypothetical protein
MRKRRVNAMELHWRALEAYEKAKLSGKPELWVACAEAWADSALAQKVRNPKAAQDAERKAWDCATVAKRLRTRT